MSSFSTITSLFASAEVQANNILSGLTEKDDIVIQSLIENFEKCIGLVESESLFSKNEEYDDLQTESLKYLSIKYYIAKLNGQVMNLLTRKSHLIVSRNYFNEFLDLCKQLNILHKDDDISESENKIRMNPENSRSYKIAKYKREKEAKQKIEALRKLINPYDQNAQKSQNLSTTISSNPNKSIGAGASGEAEADIDSSKDMEEELRELTLLQLQSFCRDSIDEISSIDQEIQLLDHMEDLPEIEELNYSSSSGSSSSSSSSNSNQNHRQIGNGQVIPGLPSRMDGPLPPSEGITVTRTAKVGDQLVMQRDVVKAEVFKPRVAGPTMSIEEYGELQLKMMQEQQIAADASSAAGGDRKPVRRIKQLEADGEEDDQDLLDQAILADRQWDDWKDSVERGGGNKMGKRF